MTTANRPPRPRTFHVEAWTGLTCTAWSDQYRATSAVTYALGAIMDGADRVYVHSRLVTNPGLVATFENGSWVRVTDAAVAAALAEGGAL